MLLTFTAALPCSVTFLNAYPGSLAGCIPFITDREIQKGQYSQAANLDQRGFVIFMYQKG